MTHFVNSLCFVADRRHLWARGVNLALRAGSREVQWWMSSLAVESFFAAVAPPAMERVMRVRDQGEKRARPACSLCSPAHMDVSACAQICRGCLGMLAAEVRTWF
jgi:hypothetical protein